MQISCSVSSTGSLSVANCSHYSIFTTTFFCLLLTDRKQSAVPKESNTCVQIQIVSSPDASEVQKNRNTVCFSYIFSAVAITTTASTVIAALE